MYRECDSDWCRRQPAEIDEAEIYVFQVPVESPGALDALCRERIDEPSHGTLTAEPWMAPGVGPIVLFAAARFSGIRSGDPGERFRGALDELDIGFFVPVRIRMAGRDRGLFAMNPYLYVDNPAGVIMGREIFGFGKILGRIGWYPRRLEFDLDSLVFADNQPATRARDGRILQLRRRGRIPALARPFASSTSTDLATAAEGEHEKIVAATAFASEQLLGQDAGAAFSLSGFRSVRVPLNKQYRDIEPGPRAAYQEMVLATFEILAIRAVFVIPSLLLRVSPLALRLFEHENVDIARSLGIRPETTIRQGLKVACRLRLTGGRFA